MERWRLVAGNFIHCVCEGCPKQRGLPAQSALYELRWDARPGYVKDARQFRGFFAGEGNRTFIPNQFLDVLIPAGPVTVVKVVGSVIRFSIGFQNKWGQAPNPTPNGTCATLTPRPIACTEPWTIAILSRNTIILVAAPSVAGLP